LSSPTHHALRDVNAGASDVLAMVYIGHVMQRKAANDKGVPDRVEYLRRMRFDANDTSNHAGL